MVASEETSQVSVQDILDNGPWPPIQIGAVILAALSVILDGFDGQLIGFAIPSIIKEWGVTRGDFAPVVAAGLLGMGVGSAVAGVVADRIGRRKVLIASVVLFGIGTALIGLAENLTMVAALRFLAGLGIGGALPTATTLAAEFTPKRIRTVVVTTTIVCVPLGGMLAGLFSIWILPEFGWRAAFFVGGSLPVVFAVALVALLPESPRWLSRTPGQEQRLRTLLARMKRDVPASVTIVDGADVAGAQGSVARLFADGRSRDTFLIWTAFFLCLMSVYAIFSWLPTMLTGEGLSIAEGGKGLTAYNLGGVVGAVLCAIAIGRFGSRWPMVICGVGGCLSAFAVSQLDVKTSFTLALVGLTAHGFFVNAVQSTLYALCAHTYPTSLRATGTAMAVTVGRVGSIASAFLGAAVITAAGGSGYMMALAISMAAVTLALWVIPSHIARDSKIAS